MENGTVESAPRCGGPKKLKIDRFESYRKIYPSWTIREVWPDFRVFKTGRDWDLSLHLENKFQGYGLYVLHTFQKTKFNRWT